MPGSRRRHTQRCPDQPPFPRVQAAEIVGPAGAAESPDGRFSPGGAAPVQLDGGRARDLAAQPEGGRRFRRVCRAGHAR